MKYYKQLRNSNTQSQLGMSLIELMISMVVSLFLLVGVVTNFISNTNSDRMRQAVSEMDSVATSVFNALRPAISHAGYASVRNIRLEKAFYTPEDGNITSPACRDASKSVIWTDSFTINDNATDDQSTRDIITVVTLADNPCLPGNASCTDEAKRDPSAYIYTDCTGGGADTSDTRVVSCSTDLDKGLSDPTQARLYSTFTLLLNNSSDNDRVFSCQGSRGGAQPIAENVEAIQYLYGVTDADENIYYRRAEQVEDDDQWGLVRSVQVGLLVRSSAQYLLKTPSDKDAYYLLKQKVSIHDRDLRRLFRVYTATINLENLKKAPL